MSSLLSIARAADDEDFRRRVKAAIFMTASAILQTTDASTSSRRLRHAAASAAGAADTLVWQMSWLVSSDPRIRDTVTLNDDGTVTVAASDEAILAACTSAWAVVAGMAEAP